jgi:hypothetical protein
VVVADTNLNDTTMHSLIAGVNERNLPLFIALVSDAKAALYTRCWSSSFARAYCVSSRPGEIAQILKSVGVDSAKADSIIEDAKDDRHTSRP